MSDNRIKCNNV